MAINSTEAPLPDGGATSNHLTAQLALGTKVAIQGQRARQKIASGAVSWKQTHARETAIQRQASTYHGLRSRGGSSGGSSEGGGGGSMRRSRSRSKSGSIGFSLTGDMATTLTTSAALLASATDDGGELGGASTDEFDENELTRPPELHDLDADWLQFGKTLVYELTPLGPNILVVVLVELVVEGRSITQALQLCKSRGYLPPLDSAALFVGNLLFVFAPVWMLWIAFLLTCVSEDARRVIQVFESVAWLILFVLRCCTISIKYSLLPRAEVVMQYEPDYDRDLLLRRLFVGGWSRPMKWDVLYGERAFRSAED